MTESLALHPATLVYNVLLLIVVGQALLIFRRYRNPVVWLVVVSGVGMAGFVLALFFSILASDHFGFYVMYLGAWLAFFHAPLLFAGSAAIVWKTVRPIGVAFAGLTILVLVIAVDAFLIEPYRLEVTNYTVTSPKVQQPTRIVVIADLQTDVIGDYERDVLRSAIEQKPDLILLAGDYLQPFSPDPELVRDFRALLQEVGLSAPLGAYAVQGDTEQPDWPELFRDLPVTTMEWTQTHKTGGIQITGLGAGESHTAGLAPATAMLIPQTDEFHIVLAHAPDFALGYVPADLLIAGHTHGGQVQLPFIGPLITFSHVSRSWAAGGLFKLDDDRTLVVSRGIGMERDLAPRLRFLCPPELVVIDLQPA